MTEDGIEDDIDAFLFRAFNLGILTHQMGFADDHEAPINLLRELVSGDTTLAGNPAEEELITGKPAEPDDFDRVHALIEDDKMVAARILRFWDAVTGGETP